MLGKIKCIVIALLLTGMVSCSSDDYKPEVPPGSEGKEYLVTVSVSKDASIHKVMAVIYEGETTKNDVISDLNETTWSKVYRKTDTENLSFTTQGFGQTDASRIEIEVTLDGEIVGEAVALGKSLTATVVIHAENEPKKDKGKKGTL